MEIPGVFPLRQVRIYHFLAHVYIVYGVRLQVDNRERFLFGRIVSGDEQHIVEKLTHFREFDNCLVALFGIIDEIGPQAQTGYISSKLVATAPNDNVRLPEPARWGLCIARRRPLLGRCDVAKLCSFLREGFICAQHFDQGCQFFVCETHSLGALQPAIHQRRQLRV